MVTARAPGETPVVVPPPPKSPPPAPSQIVTVIASPIPIFGSGGLPYCRNRLWKLSAGCAKSVATTLLSTSTTSKRVWLSLTAWSSTLPVVGPAVGNVEHPPSAAPVRLKRIAANFIVRHGFAIKTYFLSQRAKKQEVAKCAAHVIRWIRSSPT